MKQDLNNRFTVYDYKSIDAECMERYTVFDNDETCLSVSEMCLGMSEGGLAVSMFTEAVRGEHLGDIVNFSDLSKETRQHIKNRFRF